METARSIAMLWLALLRPDLAHYMADTWDRAEPAGPPRLPLGQFRTVRRIDGARGAAARAGRFAIRSRNRRVF